MYLLAKAAGDNMIGLNDLRENYTVFCDFDGTITEKDGTVELVKKYGREINNNAEEMYKAGKANNREVMALHYYTMGLSTKQYYGMIYSIAMDSTFCRFYKALGKAGIKMEVLSGSPSKGIEDYFRKMGYEGIVVHGNIMEIKNDTVLFSAATKIEESLCRRGDCAHCKSSWIEKEHRKGRKVIFIGDGLTDTCAAGHADLVFAKKSLARHCAEAGINFTPYSNFDDIHQCLFN